MTLLERFKSPTPKLWRRIGNILLIISTSVSGFTMYNDQNLIALISMITGILGKIITSLVVEENIE
jgi:hypothetical protein